MGHKISAKDHEELGQLHKAAEDALASFKAKLEEVHAEAQDHFDARSERWQEGDKGQAYSSWIADLDQAVSDIDNFTLPSVPDREPS